MGNGTSSWASATRRETHGAPGSWLQSSPAWLSQASGIGQQMEDLGLCVLLSLHLLNKQAESLQKAKGQCPPQEVSLPSEPSLPTCLAVTSLRVPSAEQRWEAHSWRLGQPCTPSVPVRIPLPGCLTAVPLLLTDIRVTPTFFIIINKISMNIRGQVLLSTCSYFFGANTRG